MRVTLFVLVVLLASCSSYDYVVDSDYSYDGNFGRYKSFTFGSNQSFTGSDVEKELIEKHLTGTLSSWGYNRTERKPGLMILYSVYYDELSFTGFDQPQFQSWMRSNYSEKQVVFKKDTLADGSLEEVLSPMEHYSSEDSYQKVKLKLREGTILISLIDRRRHKVVWQGYASGVFGPDSQRNERVMRSAIVRIMDEFKLLAFGTG